MLVIASSAFLVVSNQHQPFYSSEIAECGKWINISRQFETKEQSPAHPLIAPTVLCAPPQPFLESLRLWSSSLLTSTTQKTVFSFRSFVAKLGVGKK